MRRLPPLTLVALLAPLTALSQPKLTADAIKGLEFRNIGPAIMGGRIDDVAVVESRPSTFYVATASAGIWKTTNLGTTFEPVFEDQEVSTIGDIALAPSDPQILYVGTGEPNNRQSSSWGNGVYKTRDGGKTWEHLGLKDTLHIGRLAIHPTNPDVVYVAALGHLWGPNQERGLFKTTDGGQTWRNTKFIDADTGFVDVAMDPESPDTLYAASYQRRRAPFGYNGGGPGSGLWKTVDGGARWTKLTKGLPEGDMGRLGIAVYRRDPRLVYLLVEHAKEGGFYRSEDRGETWKKISDTNPRPSYYSKIHVDPNNDQRVWVLGAAMYYSEDGGKTFRTDVVQKIHGDYHAFWINPADSNHMLVGSDGGIHLSFDRGRSWSYLNTVALAQFYEVHYDMQKPYRVCGGLQDNGTWLGPSRTMYQQGIANEDWYRVGGGDGFYCVIDPSDPNVIYVESQDGNVARFNLATNERRVIRPEPPAGERYRFNWNSPILISPHDPKTIYYGGNRLFGSKDRGETWSLLTPDLTTAVARDPLTIFGKSSKDFFSRNDGVVHWGTITTIAESPLKAGVLWVGTDDGQVQVSRDGGATWTNVSARLTGVPKGTYVSRLEASRTGEGAVYATFDGHRSDDYRAYVLRSEDYGQTWRNVSGNLPEGGTVSVVREHPTSRDVLLAGTERGLWISFDRGGRWHKVGGKLPTVPVDDVQIHPRDNDLILATHGRGVYILDDMAALAQMTETVASADLHFFEPRAATQYRVYGNKGNTGHQAFLAPNPPDGALLTYYLKTKPGEKDEVKIVVKDAAGAVVRELKGAKAAGLNRTAWDLRLEAPVRPEGEGGAGFFGPPRGPLVLPGTYAVTVSIGSHSATGNLVVEDDERLGVSEADRKVWHEEAKSAAKLWGRADAANRALEALQRQLKPLREPAPAREGEKDKTPEPVVNAAKALGEKVDPLAKRLSRQTPLGFAGAPLAEDPDPLLPRARGLYFVTGSITAPLTPQHRDAMARLEKDLTEIREAVNALVERDVPALNRLMLENGLGRLEPGKVVP